MSWWRDGMPRDERDAAYELNGQLRTRFAVVAMQAQLACRRAAKLLDDIERTQRARAERTQPRAGCPDVGLCQRRHAA